MQGSIEKSDGHDEKQTHSNDDRNILVICGHTEGAEGEAEKCGNKAYSQNTDVVTIHRQPLKNAVNSVDGMIRRIVIICNA